MGKPVSGRLADSTQLDSLGSCVLSKKKWFQVTRSRSQTPRRHATAQSFAFQDCRVPSLQLPAAFFQKRRIDVSRLTCQLSWLEPVSRSGLSLSRNDCPFPGPHSEVKAPDLLLRHPAVRSSCPFGFRFPYAPRFAPARARSLPKSRCLTSVQHSRPFLGSPLPFGAFRTLKDQSVQSDSWLESSPSERPRLPITPRHRIYFISTDTRSPLQTR
jgi:hypothetical protein